MGDDHFIHDDGDDYSLRNNTFNPERAKMCFFYKDNDYKCPPVKVAVTEKRYRKFDVLMTELSSKMPSLTIGCRGVFTPRGRHHVQDIGKLQDGGNYICSIKKQTARGLDLERVHPPELWHHAKPKSGIRELNFMLGETDNDDQPLGKRMRYVRRMKVDHSPQPNKIPKKVTVMQNGNPSCRHILILNKRTQRMEDVLEALSNMFRFPVGRIYTIEGKWITGMSQLLNGPNAIVAGAQNEKFKARVAGTYNSPHPQLRAGRLSIRDRKYPGDSRHGTVMTDRRSKLLATRGKWRVSVTTSELPSSGTLAQVTLTVYGFRGNTGPIPLGNPDEEHFQSGMIDEFNVNCGNIGDIYKIRIAHDNTGDFPSWLCDEVRMKDIDSGEQLVFPCKRWLARDEDDHEICREIPVVRRGEPTMSTVKYEVSVSTGNLWNAGTDANVYLTIYGDRGDTGVRQLYTENKQQTFKQGQTDTFKVEAVSLRNLKRIIIGHDATGQGSGWFLDQVVIREPGAKRGDQYTFHCDKWLDEGEDDGKIVRELWLQDTYMDDIIEKRNWELEKWKFENRNQVMFFSVATGKALRIKPDGAVDGLGENKDRTSIFSVHKKKPMVHVFSSQHNPSFHFAIENGKLLGHGKGGALCEFRVRVQSDQSVVLEAVKNPLQFLTIQDNGKPGDVRVILNNDPTQRFNVYCKGMFRQRGIIMFRTSPSQAISVDHDKSVFGTGRCNRAAHFRVHKVEPGVRMFESMIYPGNFLRLKDGKFDCAGGKEQSSHFLIAKHRHKGYIVLQSAVSRGLYVGLTPEGRVHPTVDTGVRNVWLYPEVIEFGVPKSRDSGKLSSVRETRETSQEMRSYRVERSPSPPRQRTPRREVKEGDYMIIVSTSESLENGEVALVAYGDKKSSGQIMLAAPVQNGPLFQTGSNDEFKANLEACGKLYKVRLELIPKNPTKQPSWKVREVKMMDLVTKEQLKFPFNRWLSRDRDDGDIMRELPVARRGQETLEVFTYIVEVETGQDRDAGTDADVFLTLYGERGDSGRRMLQQSNNRIPFQRGQRDVFELEAVDLSKLRQIQIGHNATGRGDGWFLEEVRIKEKAGAREEFIFPCRRWFDSGQEDKRIERTLYAKEPAPTKILSAKPAPQKQEEKYSPGDWKVWTTTGRKSNCETKDEVLLYLYGTSGHIGPLPLGTGGKVFKEGQTDEFKVNIERNIGDLYKIRIGLSEADKNSPWFLEKVRLMDMTSKQEFNLKVNRWMSRAEEDHDVWREIPVAPGKERPLPINVYQVEVFTGIMDDADTDADINITIYGERGDTGKRRLFVSKSNKRGFQRGKIDVFDVEAVSLGELERVYIGHDNVRAGRGWYLEKVIIKESSDVNSRKFYFPCDKWLDGGKDDKKTERELFPADPPAMSQGDYKLWIKTASDSKPSNGGKVSIALYGLSGKSEDIELYAPSAQARLFEASSTDEFEVSVGEIGELQKIRLSREENEDWKGWHLQEVTLQDKHTKEEHVFVFNRWLGRGLDDSDLAREAAVTVKGKQQQPVYHYELSVHTGDHWAGGTDAEVYMTLFGSLGDTGRRVLYSGPSEDPKLQKGQVDKFVFEAVNLGNLQNLVIGHNGKGHGAGWFLDKVVIRETDGSQSNVQYVFPCYQWLDDGEGDAAIERALRVIETVDSRKSPKKKSGKDSGSYEVLVKTSDDPDAGTRSPVTLVLCGKHGNSKPQTLTDPKEDLLEPGKEAKYKFNVGNIGEVSKIRLEHEKGRSSSAWRCDYVKLTNTGTGEELVFYVDRWLADDKDDGQMIREVPAANGTASLPVLQYIVLIQTARGAPDGQVSINLYGNHGDTGLRPLRQTLSGPSSSMWRDGHLDAFVLPAVSVGKLQQIQLNFVAKGRDNQWSVEKVTVLEGMSAILESVCYCNSTLRDDGQGCLKSFPIAETPISLGVPDDIAYRIREKSELRSQGRWTAYIYTGGQSDGGTKERVMMVLYGTSGHTEPKHINKDSDLATGSVVKQQLSVGSIGKLFKVRIFFDSKSRNAAWFLQRIKLKDSGTGQEFNLDYSNWVRASSDNPDGTVELPAIRPDVAPLQATTYTVTVVTGDMPVAETEAEVFCTLIGQWGDTGERTLSASQSNKQIFRRGQRDEFEIETLDLGTISKLLIGHNETGRGCGWFCESVSVAAKNKSKKAAMETVFSCNRWMDSGCDDRRLVRELSPLIHLDPSDVTSAQRAKSKGIWTCHVTMATEDKLDRGQTNTERPVTLVVFGSRNMEGPLELADGKRMRLDLGQTHKFSDVKLKDIGEIEKIRVILGDERETNPVWTIQQVVLEDPSTRDTMKFNFEQWVGEEGGDITKELPVIRPGQAFKPVLEYQVSVYTSDVRNASTQAPVYINIVGQQRDSGRRALSTDNSKHFQQGQVDVFTVGAVDLGDLQKVIVTKGRGDPWYLNKVCVKAGKYSNTEYVFEADRWIGSDKVISGEVEETLTLTRTLPSSVVSPPESADDLPVSRGEWKVETVTGREGSRGDVSDLVVILCGEKGESSPLPLKSSNRKPFQANQTDTCQLKLSEDLGEMFKVRIGFRDNNRDKAWNLSKIRFEDEDTRDCFSYNFDSWVAVDNNQDGWREFPIVWPAVRTLPVVKYDVATYLGDVSRSSDKLDAFVEVFGEMGSTGRRQLKRSLNNKKKFSSNQMDEFQIEAVSVMNIEKVMVGHSNQRKGEGMFLKRVDVKETADTRKSYTCMCDRWLDAGEDDRAIERILLPKQGPVTPPRASRTPPTSPRQRSPPRPVSPTGEPWTVWTVTSKTQDAGSTHGATLVLYGDKGHTEKLLIGEEDRFQFKEGSKDKFDISVKQDPGDLYKIRLNFEGIRDDQKSWYADFNKSPSWKPEQITIVNKRTRKEFQFVTKQWLRLTDHGDFALEIPAQQKKQEDMLRVLNYHVEVFTGDVRGAGTDANVYLQISGDRGDTGSRHLHGSYTNKNKFERGQCDLFEVEAVDIGAPKKVKVSHDGYGPGSGWHLDKIVIEVPQRGNDKYVFRCGRWLDEGQDDKTLERELTLDEVIKADKPKDGDWQVLVVTDEEEDSGTDARVYLTVYGDRGKSEEKRLDGHFETGRTDHIDVWLDPKKIGRIRKIRLGHDNSGSGWRVKKVVMIDQSTKERLEFPINRYLSFDERYGDICVEAPAQWPNQKPEPVYKYQVETHTASSWGAGTDANVYINIFGRNGDCGKRSLRNSEDDRRNKFETGSVDKFYIEAVDLGRIEKIVIGHDGAGYGSGWKLDLVTVRIRSKEVFQFPYGKWLDEDKDDKVTEVEIPVSEVLRG